MRPTACKFLECWSRNRQVRKGLAVPIKALHWVGSGGNSALEGGKNQFFKEMAPQKWPRTYWLAFLVPQVELFLAGLILALYTVSPLVFRPSVHPSDATSAKSQFFGPKPLRWELDPGGPAKEGAADTETTATSLPCLEMSGYTEEGVGVLVSSLLKACDLGFCCELEAVGSFQKPSE